MASFSKPGDLKDVVIPAETPKYTYLCQGCSDHALYAVNMMIGIVVTCNSCGNQVVTVPENWVKFGGYK